MMLTISCLACVYIYIYVIYDIIISYLLLYLSLFFCVWCVCTTCIQHVYLAPDPGEAKASDIAFYFVHWRGILRLGGNLDSKVNQMAE